MQRRDLADEMKLWEGEEEEQQEEEEEEVTEVDPEDKIDVDAGLPPFSKKRKLK